MIPYIIINGKNSKDVNGLIVQNLPPISKPAIRTEKEEIDGRDGDIVTTLGYAAYDKTFTIGLKADSNVDDVIAFFDQSGTITFSNEIDKYYIFAMYEQIDFEKLIRFKTAEVTIHVQPFKYSAVDNDYTSVKGNLLDLRNFTTTVNGVTVTVNNGAISVRGTHNDPTEVYIPINALTLTQGSYKLTASANTSINSKLRLITSSPTSADTFGGAAVTVGDSVTVNANIETSTTYQYLWLYLINTSENFTLTVSVENTDTDGEIALFNRGNIYSRPTLNIKGSGDIDLFINGTQVLSIALGDFEEITIKDMNAYNGDTYLNRYVTGDYDAVRLKVGNNTITWSGDVTSIEVTNFSRWI